MTYIDALLVKIVTNYSKMEGVEQRDASLLRNTAKSIIGDFFITENQSNLLIKVLRETRHLFPELTTEIGEALATPMWSRPFRQIEQIKTLRIMNEFSDPMLGIEFTFSAQIRKVITQAKSVSNLVQEDNGKLYYADLTEKNIVELVELLKPYGFDIDPAVQSHYDLIKSWSLDEVVDKFRITSITHQNFQKQITADLGITTQIDENIIADRSVRYQYFHTPTAESTGTLTEKIARRGMPKMWIDSSQYSLVDVVTSLKELRRLPLVVVFNGFNEDRLQLKTLELLSEALATTGTDSKVGIYFRLPKSEHGTEFNEFIANNRYNQYLDIDTEVVGVNSGKIPKFLLSTPWKPMSVLAINCQVKNSKMAVYANCCDLVINYTDTPPLVEKKKVWL